MNANLIELSEEFIKKQFRNYDAVGIETYLMFTLAEKAGLYKSNTYGSEFSKALSNTVDIEPRYDSDGFYSYSVFILKKGD